jgi:hypothetical protein
MAAQCFILPVHFSRLSYCLSSILNNGRFELEYGLVDGSKAIPTHRTRPLFTFLYYRLALLMLQSKTCLPLKCKGYSMLVINVS